MAAADTPVRPVAASAIPRSWWFVDVPGDRAYRPDIDSLRALAVGLVIAFHLGFGEVSGGFVGVDVFFVISGFLIGSLILGELQSERFSIARFYERRIRRILPALTVVLLATSAASFLWLFPKPYEKYGTSLAAAAASLSNIYFWQTSGYLTGVGTSKALLHTWSLAVEEQFYIVLPPVLILLRRVAKGRMATAIALLAAASFALAVIGVQHDANTAYYLPHTRAWELLLGVLVAAVPNLKLGRPWLRAFCALVGFALIMGAAILYNRSTPFPGLAALPPCLGAALVILAHRDGSSWLERVLTFRPIVFIGLISYSLYLWHWPLIDIYREHFGVDSKHVSGAVRLAMVTAMLGLSVLSWWFVERPLRRIAMPRATVFALAAGSVAALIVGGLALRAAHGLPGRFPPEAVRLASYLDYDFNTQFRAGTCFIDDTSTFRDFKPGICLKQDARRPSMLLIGDSFAAHLYAGLAATFPDRSVLQATASGCKPGLHPLHGDEDCRRLFEYVLTEHLPAHPVDMLVISGRWLRADLADLGVVIDAARARGITVVVAGAPAEYESDLPVLLARGVATADAGLAARNLSAVSARRDAEVAAFVIKRGARYASTFKALCDAGGCLTRSPDGAPVQFDYGHLTREGSRLVIQRLATDGAFRLADDARR